MEEYKKPLKQNPIRINMFFWLLRTVNLSIKLNWLALINPAFFKERPLQPETLALIRFCYIVSWLAFLLNCLISRIK
jgi:hypothetical protein